MSGLRERKREEKRRDLMFAALRLFSEHGYDSVTVQQIADAANVSHRTFFRYFGTKAEACFGFVAEGLERLRSSDDVLATIDAQIRAHATRVAKNTGFYATQVRLTMEHPKLRAKREEVMLTIDDAVAEALLREHPALDPVVARLAASLPTGVVTATMEAWCAAGAPAPAPDFEPPLAAARTAMELLLRYSAAEPFGARPMTDL